MRRILVTGGTVFVSRYVANYFAQKGDDVYVLNRNSKPQLPNVTLIEGDRNDLGEKLKGYEFDAVLDITAYTREHVENLVNALGKFGDYIMVSSSAVYPETNPQSFTEDQICGPTSIGVPMAPTSWRRRNICGRRFQMPTSCARPISTAPCRMFTGSLLSLSAQKARGNSISPAMAA